MAEGDAAWPGTRGALGSRCVCPTVGTVARQGREKAVEAQDGHGQGLEDEARDVWCLAGDSGPAGDRQWLCLSAEAEVQGREQSYSS